MVAPQVAMIRDVVFEGAGPDLAVLQSILHDAAIVAGVVRPRIF